MDDLGEISVESWHSSDSGVVHFLVNRVTQICKELSVSVGQMIVGDYDYTFTSWDFSSLNMIVFIEETQSVWLENWEHHVQTSVRLLIVQAKTDFCPAILWKHLHNTTTSESFYRKSNIHVGKVNDIVYGTSMHIAEWSSGNMTLWNLVTNFWWLAECLYEA